MEKNKIEFLFISYAYKFLIIKDINMKSKTFRKKGRKFL